MCEEWGFLNIELTHNVRSMEKKRRSCHCHASCILQGGHSPLTMWKGGRTGSSLTISVLSLPLSIYQLAYVLLFLPQLNFHA